MGAWIVPVLLKSLGLTLVLETGLGWLFSVRNRWDITLIGLVNLLTNPAVVFLYYINLLYVGWNPVLVTAVLEAAAVTAEAICYRAAARKIRHPWRFALGANLFSFAAGAVITALL